MTRILTIDNKKDKRFLSRTVKETLPGENMSAEEIRTLIKEMREIMRKNDGVGLAANQIGKNVRLFVAEFDGKFYAVINPEITRVSREKEIGVEGCLSIPDRAVEIERPYQITLKGVDKNGKRIKWKVWGHLARIFQHEVDHLNGKLITDYMKQ